MRSVLNGWAEDFSRIEETQASLKAALLYRREPANIVGFFGLICQHRVPPTRSGDESIFSAVGIVPGTARVIVL
jgi:hypothetical protein